VWLYKEQVGACGGLRPIEAGLFLSLDQPVPRRPEYHFPASPCNTNRTGRLKARQQAVRRLSWEFIIGLSAGCGRNMVAGQAASVGRATRVMRSFATLRAARSRIARRGFPLRFVSGLRLAARAADRNDTGERTE
jgi:hypothetical protein